VSEEVEYFKFGGVRGVIGLAIALLQLLFLSKLQIPSLQTGLQQLTSFSAGDTTAIGGTVSGTVAVATLIVMIPFAYLLSGLMYWVGKHLVEYADVNVSGFWKVALSGIFGMLVVGILMVFALNSMLSALTTAGLATVSANIILLAVAALPIALVLEIGYAGITWWVYKGMGWPTPA